MLVEIFCQKRMVSDVISAFLDNLKPKMFFIGQPWWPTQENINESLDMGNAWVFPTVFHSMGKCNKNPSYGGNLGNW